MTDGKAAGAPPPNYSLMLDRVTFGFPGGGDLFSNFTVSLAHGVTAVLGPSGAGKTTLLRLIAGRLTTRSGDIRNREERRIAWMGQAGGLLPWASAEENLLLGARLRKEKLDRTKARAMLGRVGLIGHEHKRPAELSGGMQQRVALARTLMEDAGTVLLDEPFAHLDAGAKAHLYKLTANEFAGKTVILVTHDPMEAMTIANRVIVLAGVPARIVADIEVTGHAPRDPRAPSLDAYAAELSNALVTP